MDTVLRPMSTGEVLDRTFGLYKRNFPLFLGIAVPAPALVLLLNVLQSVAAAMPGVKSALGATAVYGFGIVYALGLLALLLGFAISNGATIRAIAALHHSKPTSIRQSYAELRGHYWRVIWVTVVVAVLGCMGAVASYLVIVLIGIAAGGLAAKMGPAGVALAVIVMVGAVIGGLLLALTVLVRYSMAVQACVIENITIRQALRRSVFLAKGSRNRIITIYVLFSVSTSALWGCMAIVAGVLSSFVHSPRIEDASLSLALFLTLVLTMPLILVAMSLAYYDERVRKEGYDLQVMIEGLEAPKASAVGASV